MKWFLFCLSFLCMTNAMAELPAMTYNQKIDHFNNADTRRFAQRFWYDKSYAENSDSPVLLYICPEGRCSDRSMKRLEPFAPQLRAHRIALEHRYYGESQPFSDLSTPHLQYLNLKQIIQDYVDFQRDAIQALNLKGPWIVVGGSYAATVAAMLRTLHPNKFVGALASSSDIHRFLDLPQFDNFNALIMGPTCSQGLRDIVDKIEAEIKDPAKFQKYKELFKASSLREPLDFLMFLADTGAMAVQYNDDLEKFCKAIETEGMAGLAKVTDPEIVNYEYQAAENPELNETSKDVGFRQWTYQQCTELGGFQSVWTKDKNRARALSLNIKYHAQGCKRAFGITNAPSVNKTNFETYARVLHPQTSRILFTNGKIDPVILQSISPSLNNNTNPNITAIDIEGAAHCEDLELNPSNNAKAAQQYFINLVKTWLNQMAHAHF